MKLLFALSIVVAVIGGGVATSTAQAHFLHHKKNLTLSERIEYFNHSIDHEKNSIIWFRKVRANVWHSLSRVTYGEGESNRAERLSFAHRVYREIQFHKQALRWHKELLARYKQKWVKLHPPPPPAPSHYSAWMCIHSYEGSWTDSGAPYYGGLQMDMEFQQTYGSELLRTKGTANNWTPAEQMAVAEKAYASGRGFYPWPNTARYCGLI